MVFIKQLANSIFSTAVSKPITSLCRHASLGVSTLILLLPTAAIAAASHPHQESICKPAGEQWQCTSQAAMPGAYPKPALAAQKSKTVVAAKHSPATAAGNVQWDWIAKPQLEDKALCKTGCDGAYIEPPRDWQDADKKPAGAAIRAAARRSAIEGDDVLLTGDVVITQGDRRLQADQVQLNRNTGDSTIEGQIELREPGLLMRAEQATINSESGLGEFRDTQFLFHDSGFRGTAKSLQRISANELELQQGSMTQCTPGDDAWAFNAAEIHLDTDKGWGTAKHARLNINDVPVFYTPYITFPLDGRRKTGLLWPSFASGNDNGFELSAPYYLNLAPNYDATIAPRFIEKRGTMTELETRYMNSWSQWVIAGAYLQDDLYKDSAEPIPLTSSSDVPPVKNRWLQSISHQGNGLGLTSSIDYKKVSDIDFFDDLSTDSLEVKRSSNVNQQALLSYNQLYWQSQLKLQQYQTIDDDLTSQYKLLPQFSLKSNRYGVSFQPELIGELQYTDFQHDDSIEDGGSFVTGQRVYTELGVSYPMYWSAGFIVPTVKARHLSYNLDAVLPGNDDSPSATTPLATLDMGLIFERPLSFGSSRFVQTLEPRFYYFYSDREDQTGNPDFDTRQLNFGFSQLFSDTRFTGHDRLDDANQSAIGITSRFVDQASGREVVSLSLGQIFYFQDREVSLSNNIGDQQLLSNSNIATELQYQPSDRTWLSNTLLWDSRQDLIEEGSLSLHHRRGNNTLYNLGYVYRRDGASTIEAGIRDLSQGSASVLLPISERWRLMASYRYDVEEHRALDHVAGLQYEDCCWMVRVLYQQTFDDEFIDTTSNRIVTEQDYAFIVEFQLKGLGSLGNKAESLLKETFLGYEDLD